MTAHSPTMTRRHFKLIADTIASLPPSDDPGAIALKDTIINRFAQRLKLTNPAFLTGRFIDACRAPDK